MNIYIAPDWLAGLRALAKQKNLSTVVSLPSLAGQTQAQEEYLRLTIKTKAWIEVRVEVEV